MRLPSVSGRLAFALLMAMTAGLIARAALQHMVPGFFGVSELVGLDLADYIVPLVFLLLSAPLCRQHWPIAKQLFNTRGITISLILSAVLAGLLLRIALWCQRFVARELEIVTYDTNAPIFWPEWSLGCIDDGIFLAALISTGVLTPLMEELLHRGYVMSALRKQHVWLGIIVSSLLFAVMHISSTWPFAFIVGILLAWYFLRCGSLWPPALVHVTYNSLAIIDSRCLKASRIVDQFTAQNVELLIYATIVGLLSFGLAAWLCVRKPRGSSVPRELAGSQ